MNQSPEAAGAIVLNMRCLAIGIMDAPPLEPLQGAVNGAKAFGVWAKGLGIQTEVLTDEDNPVGFDDVREAFGRLFAGKPKISRLIVYFAGHGLARDAGEDLWLLSKWETEQRAIAVGALRHRLERFGIEQLTIISDACRSLAASADSADLTADPVLGKGPFDPRVPLVDMLRAASPFHAAYMVIGQEPKDDLCIFSGVLNEALSGAHEGAFELPEKLHISNFSLAQFLMGEVKARADQYKVKLTPDIVTGFRPPSNIYLESRPLPPPRLRSWPTADSVGTMDSSRRLFQRRRGWSTKALPNDQNLVITDWRTPRVNPNQHHYDEGHMDEFRGLSRFKLEPRFKTVQDNLKEVFAKDFSGWEVARQRQKQETENIRDSYDAEDRPTHFETNVGFSIAGATAKRATLGRFAIARNDRTNSWWRVEPAAPNSLLWPGALLSAPVPLLIEFANGNWGGAAALPGFVATFTVAGGQVVSLIYRPMNTPEGTRDTELAVAQLRAGALTSEGGYDLAATLREEKEKDPVRGVIAAYLYDAQGDIDSVRRTAFFLAIAGVPIPFDIALLARLRAERTPLGGVVVDIPAVGERAPRSKEEEKRYWTYCATSARKGTVAGIFPWLRQGWPLMESEDLSPLILDGLAKLQSELLPSTFTTVTPGGGKRLSNIINEE